MITENSNQKPKQKDQKKTTQEFNAQFFPKGDQRKRHIRRWFLQLFPTSGLRGFVNGLVTGLLAFSPFLLSMYAATETSPLTTNASLTLPSKASEYVSIIKAREATVHAAKQAKNAKKRAKKAINQSRYAIQQAEAILKSKTRTAKKEVASHALVQAKILEKKALRWKKRIKSAIRLGKKAKQMIKSDPIEARKMAVKAQKKLNKARHMSEKIKNDAISLRRTI